MYDHKLMAYYKNQSNRGTIADSDVSSGKHNPSCGDEVSFTGLIKNDTVTDLKYEGAGCIISQGTASLLCEYARGKTIQELPKITVDDILAMLELKLGPNRRQCVELPLQVLQEALSNYAE